MCICIVYIKKYQDNLISSLSLYKMMDGASRRHQYMKLQNSGELITDTGIRSKTPK